MPKGTEPSGRRGTIAPACSSQLPNWSLIRWCTVAGESGPTAFLSGSNSPARSVSTMVQRPAMRQSVEDELLELDGVGLVRLDGVCPASST